jgi:hypothetical protein
MMIWRIDYISAPMGIENIRIGIGSQWREKAPQLYGLRGLQKREIKSLSMKRLTENNLLASCLTIIILHHHS